MFRRPASGGLGAAWRRFGVCLAAPLYTPELYPAGIGHTNVGNVEALRGLTGLNELGLNNTRVKNLDALKEFIEGAEELSAFFRWK